jgi:NAD(P)-dependent dehydrogenase (short-subunit alcohol dehydrogenase family)
MELRNKAVLITGGTRIGAVVARSLARQGCDVALTYHRSSQAAANTRDELVSLGVRSLTVKADMTRDADIRALMKKTSRAFGRLDALVHMASVYEQTTWERLGEKEWRQAMDANLKSAYLAVLHAAPFLAVRTGRVVHISDWIAASGRPRYKGYAPYYTSKSGLIGLMQVQALELAPRVLVNAVAPGPILPPPGLSRKELKDVEKETPLRRWGGAEEIAKAVLFLLETDFVTGECIRVDGGRHLY